MYQDQQTIGHTKEAYRPAPIPVTLNALQEASDGMDRSISEALSLAEMLASRLSGFLMPAPSGVGGNEAKTARSYSPYVENVMRQRSRVDAISAQLGDLLNRLEV